MKFQEERKRYFNPLAKFVLHMIATASFILAIGLALFKSSWIPIIGFFIFISVLEGFYWYDVFYGWPLEAVKKKGETEKY